jgi:hypothetical protein
MIVGWREYNILLFFLFKLMELDLASFSRHETDMIKLMELHLIALHGPTSRAAPVHMSPSTYMKISEAKVG